MKRLWRLIGGSREGDRMTPAARGAVCVIVTGDEVSRTVQEARIALLTSEWRKIEDKDVFIVGPRHAEARFGQDNPVARVVSPESMSTELTGRTVIILFTDQYHVSHEWMRELLGLAAAQNRPQIPNTDATTLCGHLMLKPHFVVLPPGETKRMSGRISGGRLLAVLTSMGTTGSVPGANRVDVTPGNVNTLYRQAALTSIPLTYIVETTNHCNYSCYMCPYHGTRQSDLITYIKPGTEKHMPWPLFRRLVDEIAELEHPYEDSVTKTVVPYNRGEFLLYPQWREALTIIKERGLGAYFSSNGSLWTDEDIRFILDARLDSLQLSIDGFSEDTHSEIRLNRDYGKVVRTLKGIMKAREEGGFRHPAVQLAHTINERNRHRVRDYVDHWIGKVDALFLGPENYMEMENRNKRYKIQYVDIEREPDIMRPPCNTLLINMWIQSDGECHLCIGSKNRAIGNVQESSLKEILASEIRSEIIGLHSEGNYANPVCRNCEHWFSAYWRNEENDRYVARLSPDTQYYTRKGGLETWWQ